MIQAETLELAELVLKVLIGILGVVSAFCGLFIASKAKPRLNVEQVVQQSNLKADEKSELKETYKRIGRAFRIMLGATVALLAVLITLAFFVPWGRSDVSELLEKHDPVTFRDSKSGNYCSVSTLTLTVPELAGPRSYYG